LAKKTDLEKETVLASAKGRCQCRGECGENHRWSKEAKPDQCRAPGGCTIRRLTQNPSFWRMAPTETRELAFEEEFIPKDLIVVLEATEVLGETMVLCAYCKSRILRRVESGETQLLEVAPVTRPESTHQAGTAPTVRRTLIPAKPRK
jgi:hypothetical protein